MYPNLHSSFFIIILCACLLANARRTMNEEVDAITTSRCENGGVYNVTSDDCICPALFNGALCESPLCYYVGTQLIKLNGTCKCKRNYYGVHCENVIKRNDDQFDDNKCYCVSNYYGRLLQRYCIVDDNMNGRQRRCQCHSGYFGLECTCQQADLSKLLNGQFMRRFTTMCGRPYKNTHSLSLRETTKNSISDKSDESTSIICQNGGIKNKNNICNCPPLYAGRECEITICSFEGTEYVKESGNCHCKPMYTGLHCEEIIACIAGYLKNNKCNCPPRVYGPLCQYRCWGRYTGERGHNCHCHSGYFGNECNCQRHMKDLQLVIMPDSWLSEELQTCSHFNELHQIWMRDLPDLAGIHDKHLLQYAYDEPKRRAMSKKQLNPGTIVIYCTVIACAIAVNCLCWIMLRHRVPQIASQLPGAHTNVQQRQDSRVAPNQRLLVTNTVVLAHCSSERNITPPPSYNQAAQYDRQSPPEYEPPDYDAVMQSMIPK